MIVPANRLSRLPSYKMNDLVAVKRRLVAEGRDVIDLSVGDTDLAPPQLAVEALHEALTDPAMSRYPFQLGLVQFREAVSRYMERRFGVTVNPMTEVLPLIGCKEGLAHLPLALLDPGDVCVIPQPGYPGYTGAALAGADVEWYPLRREDDFLVELDRLPAERLAKTRLVFANYPNNPTTAVAPLDYLERLVDTCSHHGIALAYDNPYCEVAYDGYRAPSILEVAGARDVALEFHSFSKSFSLTGWRLGWAVGSADLIAALAKVKSYYDTGVFLALQYAGARLLDNAESLIPEMVRVFTERRDRAVQSLCAAGLSATAPRATMYLWVPLPERYPSAAFATELLEREAVAVMPGSAFGAPGEGYFRLALTVTPDRLEEAGARAGQIVSGIHEAGVRT